MANRRNDPNSDAMRLHQQKQDQEQEQEQEQEQSQDQEQEHSRAQNQLGNAAIAAMIGAKAGQDGQGMDEGGGHGQSVRPTKAHEKEGQDFGGDDIVDDVPITLDDLTRSWNPGTKKSDDRPKFVEPMPDDDLPPEDPAFLARILELPHSGTLPRLQTLDGLLQPSAEVIAASTTGWARATTRWARPTPGWRALAAMIDGNPPSLQSLDARVLTARAAVGALGSCLLAESPAVTRAPRLETAALIELCLELEGRAHRTRNLVQELEEAASKLPKAADLVRAHIPSTGQVRLRELPEAVKEPIETALAAVVRWTPLEPSLPALLTPTAPEPDPDDPLGLDSIMDEFLPEVDLEAGVYGAALQTAERLATEASLTRIRFAALCRVVDDVAGLWSAAPGATLATVGTLVDKRVDDVLRLLLEVARAVQKRRFPPPKIRNGLVRGARQLDAHRAEIISVLAQVCGALLPGLPDVPPRPQLRPDPLTEALDMKAPADALPWVAELPTGADRVLARCSLSTLASVEAETLRADWNDLRSLDIDAGEVGPRLTVSTIMAAHTALRAGAHDVVHAHAEAIRRVGRARRNGLLVAEGALLSMEAHIADGKLDDATRVREEAGRLCWDLGARGALSLLARWTPAEDDDQDFSPFFDYGWDDPT